MFIVTAMTASADGRIELRGVAQKASAGKVPVGIRGANALKEHYL